MAETENQPVAISSADVTSADGISENSASNADDSAEKVRALMADYEARLDAVADLITRVRHEINNPLTGVLGQTQLLLREDLNEKARKRAETIEGLAIRIRDIVAQLRQVQRASRTKPLS